VAGGGSRSTGTGRPGFIEAFQPQFRSLLDVEKWWALAAANFTGRNAASAWSTPFALRKLDDALHPLGVARGVGGRPARLSVEEVLVTWDFSRQGPLLRQLLQQLQSLRVNAPPKVGALMYRYAEVLGDYLDARGRAGFSPVTRGRAPGNVKLILRQAVGDLRDLDAARARLAAEPEPPAKPADPGAASTPTPGGT
jgi:hypothetical protein